MTPFPLVEDRADPEEVEPITQQLVRELDSFPALVSIVYECGRRSQSYFRIYEKINITSLRKLASERFQDDRNIFEELSGRHLVFVLYQWATNWETDSDDNRLIVQNYVLSLIDRRPEYLGRVLCGFRSRTISGEYSTFNFQAFVRAFDPSIIEGRLQDFGGDTLTEEGKEAVELFRQQYAAYKASESDVKKRAEA